MRVLVIEDDVETARYIVRALQEAGYEAASAGDGRSGLQTALNEQWELIIVDRMLPHVDGLQLVGSLRRSGTTAAILMLTTLGGVDDRVQGLNAGADDYLAKPFSLAELKARLRALNRRSEAQSDNVLRFADLELDPELEPELEPEPTAWSR